MRIPIKTFMQNLFIKSDCMRVLRKLSKKINSLMIHKSKTKHKTHKLITNKKNDKKN